jgi:hypothetical protein
MTYKIENQENIDEPIRADGRCICEICGKEYLKHQFSEHKSSDGEPYLNRLCDGTLVKL